MLFVPRQLNKNPMFGVCLTSFSHSHFSQILCLTTLSHSNPIQMTSESSNPNKSNRPQNSMAFPPPPQSEPLPCPRCDSLNTKFCYYNNYNLSQPRHFCKSCRRYWTHGGTLRDVPVGGGSRKNSKRSRYHNIIPSSSSSSSSSVSLPSPAPAPGTFTSLLSSHGSGFLALGGYGPDPGSAHSTHSASAFDDMGFGLGRGLWGSASTYPDVGDLYPGAVPPDTSSSGYNTWQMNATDAAGSADGDLLGWPDLAISMQGKTLK